MPDSGAVLLSYTDLLVAAGLVVAAGTLSFVMRLGLEKRLAVAAVRTTVQLLLVGYVLKWVFSLNSAYAVAAAALLMAAFASRAAVRRPSRTFSGATGRAFLTLVFSGFLTTLTVTGVIVGVDPWHKAQYVIPLLGMALGNGLTGLSLCMDYILETLAERRGEVEMELALGATRWEAARGPLSEGVRRGMIPIINTMMVVGIVSLPGMMTGQILQGANPLNAVKYQIVVMFMISTGTALATILMALLIFRRLFSARHQLRAELIRKR